jgi:signal transduction histidine kinase
LENLGLILSGAAMFGGGAIACVALALVRVRDATRRLTMATEHARSLLDALGQPVLVVDHIGRVREANAAARAWFGPPDALPYWLAGRVVLTGSNDDLSPMFGRAGMVEGRVDRIGAARTVQVSVRPGRLMDGGPSMVCGIVDVTALKLAQEHQAKAALAEREANRTKSQFLANMSHELRTPLNAILGYADLLKEDATQEQIEDLAKIERSGGDLLSLIDQVLDLAKLEAGRLSFVPEDTSIDGALQEVFETLEPLARKNGNALTIGATDLGTAMLDPQRLRQVLINLGANACKFTENGRVTLSGRDDGDHVVLTVSDTGIGIAQADLDRLFEPFVQVDASTRRRFGGTGLGLALSRHFTERMGGHIAVDSVTGEGSTLTVTIPRIPPRLNPALAETPPGVPASLHDTLLED